MKTTALADEGLRDLLSLHAAPLRISREYDLDAKPAAVFGILGDLEGITRFFPLIHHAQVHHPATCAGAGTLRVCSIRGMGKVREEVRWWSEPHGYAYSATGRFVPLRDHLGVITISDAGGGRSQLLWRQYFRPRLGPLGWLFPWMMGALMDRAVANVERMLPAKVQ